MSRIKAGGCRWLFKHSIVEVQLPELELWKVIVYLH